MKLFLMLLWRTWLPDWAHDRSPDPYHFYRRQFTAAYKRRYRFVSLLWFIALVTIGLVASLPVAIIIVIFASCISFAILDETEKKAP
ncbi:hypothetical protein [Neptunomonas sp. XY-337]|uniref:hypothetical protein n=1 Tax=Neptunomonas sp. XY-337 TaxID=2561897 RepID=UPI0010AA577F|nr:hypothetical protein [Neptunomonas sp. XY-337]